MMGDKKSTVTEHRAICKDDSFKGPWRTDSDDAYADETAHRNEPGNTDHITTVITRQKKRKKIKK